MSEQALDDRQTATNVPERFDPATMHGDLLEAEHLARYQWASAIASDRRVLDAGCGTAYGTFLLAGAGALEVVGVDRAGDVLASARDDMPAGVVLEEADVMALPYDEGRFDLVVCFEVIEHLDDPGRALDEFRRVLSPTGVLAISSPNRDVYPSGNPHHVHEYTPDELELELSRRFAFTSIERQNTWISSGVVDDEQFQLGQDAIMATSLQVRKLIADTPGRELYTVALASQSELPAVRGTLELTAPIELRKWDALWHEQAELLEEQRQLLTAHEQVFSDHATVTGQLQREMDELRNQLAKAESELARMPELDAELRDLLSVNDELLRLNHELQVRQTHMLDLEETAARYAVLVGSSSWKLTRPMRQIAVLMRRLLR